MTTTKQPLSLAATRFRSWIRAQGFTQAKVALELGGWDHSYLSSLLNGRRLPGRKHAGQIELLTDQHVLAFHWDAPPTTHTHKD